MLERLVDEEELETVDDDGGEAHACYFGGGEPRRIRSTTVSRAGVLFCRRSRDWRLVGE